MQASACVLWAVRRDKLSRKRRKMSENVIFYADRLKNTEKCNQTVSPSVSSNVLGDFIFCRLETII